MADTDLHKKTVQSGPFPHETYIQPFWRSELHPLDDHRSTEDLPTDCDILIIGAGYAGVTTAYHLLNDNPDPPSIVLLEARQACSGATARNGRYIQQKAALLKANMGKPSLNLTNVSLQEGMLDPRSTSTCRSILRSTVWKWQPPYPTLRFPMYRPSKT